MDQLHRREGHSADKGHANGVHVQPWCDLHGQPLDKGLHKEAARTLPEKNGRERNLTKHHITRGATALKTKKELLREIDTLSHQGLQNIDNSKRWMLDLDTEGFAEMNSTEMAYTMFELGAAKAHDELVFQKSGGGD